MTFDEWGKGKFPGWSKSGLERWKTELEGAWNAALEYGAQKPTTNSAMDAIAASEAYCRKHASKDVTIQRAFLDGVAWREQHQ